MVFGFDDAVGGAAFAGDVSRWKEKGEMLAGGKGRGKGREEEGELQVDDLAFFVLHLGVLEGRSRCEIEGLEEVVVSDL